MKSYLPRLEDFLFFLIFTGAVLLGPRMLNQDGDLPRHMAIGRYVLSGHFPPMKDIFSHTVPGAPFAPHKWLSGVLFYLSFLLFDEKGLVILSAGVLATTFTYIYTQSVSISRFKIPTFFLIIWGAALTSLHWIVRPHIISMLLFSVWLILTDKIARGKTVNIFLLPVIMLLWNNIHGEYISGFLVTLAYGSGWVWDYFFNRENTTLETGKRLAISLCLSLLVTLLNPVSVMAWGTITNWLGNQYLMAHTQETIPPDFAQAQFLPLLAFIALSIFLLAKNTEIILTGRAITLAGFSVLTLLSARNIHFYGLAAPFCLATTVMNVSSNRFLQRYETFFENIGRKNKRLFFPIFTVIIWIFLLILTPMGNTQRFSTDVFPVKAVEWLQTHPQKGEMFNTFDWGGYLSFTLPEKKVFIDSQGDVYGEEFIRKYEKVITLSPGWQEILGQYNVKWALIPIKWPLANALKSSGWSQVYLDETAIILVAK